MIKLSSILSLLLVFTLLTSCSTPDEKNTGEISLKADRKILDKYRSEIPEDVKDENDFMALVLKDISDGKSTPQQVRDRYYKEVRRKRDSFQKQHRKIREKFNRDDKKKRDEFLSGLKKERDRFVSSKPKPDDSREFFQEQNTKRTAFFQDQSDNRKEFESQMDQARRDFNEDMNLKQKQFDDAHREYAKNYLEKEKQKKLEKSAPLGEPGSSVSAKPAQSVQSALPPASYPGQDKDLEEFDSLKNGKRETLGN